MFHVDNSEELDDKWKALQVLSQYEKQHRQRAWHPQPKPMHDETCNPLDDWTHAEVHI